MKSIDSEKSDLDREIHGFLAGSMAGTSIERMIEWVDTDAAGHQHNSVIMRFVEAAEAQLMRELELKTYFSMSPRVRQEIDFKSKMFFGQAATTAIKIVHLGRSSLTFEFRVWAHPFEGAGLSVAAEGKMVTVCVPNGTTSSAPWPGDIRAGIEARAGK